jgi:hypothetical protein
VIAVKWVGEEHGTAQALALRQRAKLIAPGIGGRRMRKYPLVLALAMENNANLLQQTSSLCGKFIMAVNERFVARLFV